jgi:DNA-binding transcriptional LysR family regulator
MIDAMDTRISLYKLEVFCRVVESDTVTAAAESIGVAQPVVTGHLRSIERRLGVKLFDRVGRRLELTDAGRVVYDWARDVGERTREAGEVIDRLAGAVREPVTIAACTGSSTYLLPSLVVRFGETRPGADVQLRSLSSERVVAAVREGSCDFGVASYLDVVDVGPDLERRHLLEEDLVLVAGAGHEPLGSEIAAEELGDLSFVCTPRGSARRRTIDAHVSRLGLPPRRIVVELGQGEAVKAAVRQGVGVALLTRGSVAADLEAGLLREVAVRGPRLTFHYDVLLRRGRRLTAAQRALLATIEESVRPAASPPA